MHINCSYTSKYLLLRFNSYNLAKSSLTGRAVARRSRQLPRTGAFHSASPSRRAPLTHRSPDYKRFTGLPPRPLPLKLTLNFVPPASSPLRALLLSRRIKLLTRCCRLAFLTTPSRRSSTLPAALLPPPKDVLAAAALVLAAATAESAAAAQLGGAKTLRSSSPGDETGAALDASAALPGVWRGVA